MAENKTKETKASVKTYLAGIVDDERRKDCTVIAAIMSRVTGCQARMWGTSIVGFGRYHYKYPSGREGNSCLVGFASRKSDISIYLVPGHDVPAAKGLLARLGAHKAGKGCLYIKRLADVDGAVLEALLEWSVAETRKRYPS